MKAIVRGFSFAVRRFPAGVIVVTLVLAGVLGSFANQVVIATGNESFSPDNAEIQALEDVSELFGSEQEAVLQVIVRDPGGDVISADGLAASAAIEEAIREVAGDAVADTPQRPGVVSFLAPALQAAQMQGIPMEGLDDDAVDGLYESALSQMPAEQTGFVTSLLSSGSADTTASAGLVLAFFNTDGSDPTAALDKQIELEQAIVERLDGIETDLEVRPFSFNLLFGEVDSFASEVGRLFAFAGIIIVVILLFVYWLRPRGSATALQTSRRTLADTLLTMLTILMAIVMMQGGGVLLEKWGVIDAFSAVTQIVPILMIGLGVDYGIHLMSRYREEVGQGHGVDESMSLSIRTSGVALVLATLTTAIGFLTNVANPVPALADFGILAALGIFFSFLLMMTFVPAVRLLLDRRAAAGDRLPVDAMASQGERILPQLMGKTAVVAERFPYVAIVAALILGGLGFFGFTQLDTRFSFTDFLPEDAPAVQTLDIIEDEFGGGFGEQTQVLITDDGDGDFALGANWNRMVEAASALGGIESVSTFDTPAGPTANANSPVSVLQQMFIGGVESAPPEVLAAAQQVGLGEDLSVAPDADVSTLYDALATAAPAQWPSVVHTDAEGTVDAVLFDIRTTANEAEVADLRNDLDQAFAPLEDSGLDAVATSQGIIGDVVVNELTASQSSSLLLTVVAAGLVLVLYFWLQNRRPFLGVITILPVALVVLWTYGLMFVAGIPFGPVTATLAALAIGIGVPFTIHIARRFEEDRVEMDDVESAIRSTTTHTGGALAGSAFTTMAGFGILITSSLVPFKQMGQVTVFAIGLALVASILVLPSLLVVWERWHRRRGS